MFYTVKRIKVFNIFAYFYIERNKNNKTNEYNVRQHAVSFHHKPTKDRIMQNTLNLATPASYFIAVVITLITPRRKYENLEHQLMCSC